MRSLFLRTLVVIFMATTESEPQAGPVSPVVQNLGLLHPSQPTQALRSTGMPQWQYTTGYPGPGPSSLAARGDTQSLIIRSSTPFHRIQPGHSQLSPHPPQFYARNHDYNDAPHDTSYENRTQSVSNDASHPHLQDYRTQQQYTQYPQHPHYAPAPYGYGIPQYLPGVVPPAPEPPSLAADVGKKRKRGTGPAGPRKKRAVALTIPETSEICGVGPQTINANQPTDASAKTQNAPIHSQINVQEVTGVSFRLPSQILTSRMPEKPNARDATDVYYFCRVAHSEAQPDNFPLSSNEADVILKSKPKCDWLSCKLCGSK